MNIRTTEVVADRMVGEFSTFPEENGIAPISEKSDEQPLSDSEERLSGVFDATNEGDEPEEEPEEEERTFKTIARSLEELPIDAIQHYDLIPDFVIPTEAEHPIVVKSDEGLFCIEGWSLIEDAKSNGKTTVLCEVDELDTHSDEEICLRKGGIRSLTRGGTYAYAEMLRNTRDLLDMLLSSDEDLRIYGHGERRYGEGFKKNREEDIRHILSMRLGRDRDTVNIYLTHGEYLSNELFKIFIDEKAPKKFFETTQGKKRIEIKTQKESNLSTGRITEAVSTFMHDQYEQYVKDEANKKKGKTKTETPQPQNENPPTVPTTHDPIDANRVDEAGIDEYPTTQEETRDATQSINLDLDKPVTIETIKSGTLSVSRRLAERVNSQVELIEIENSLKAELESIMELLNMIASLNKMGE